MNTKLKDLVNSTPVLGHLARYARLKWRNKFMKTSDYWESRYESGDNSGSGSYGHLAEFKARVINDFVKDNDIGSVIEFGCGDGNQLSFASYPNYIGLDVSPTILKNCSNKFRKDKTKSFYLYNSCSFLDNAKLFQCDLALSLDVIYHLLENDVYSNYMEHLFGSAKKFVIIYSSNFESYQQKHERRRRFTDWIEKAKPNWRLLRIIKNPYPYDENDPENTSRSDFYIYQQHPSAL